MTHTEKCGEDSLAVIYKDHISSGETHVVRWCVKCGAIVVDCDYDGRTLPGEVMSMHFPNLTR
jgi:hypothetical protein